MLISFIIWLTQFKSHSTFTDFARFWPFQQRHKFIHVPQQKTNALSLFVSDGKHYVRHQIVEGLNPNRVKKSVIGGGGSAIVWGMFSAAVVDLIQEHECKGQSEPSPTACVHQPVSQQLSCRIMPHVTQQSGWRSSFILNIVTMTWPAQSPDLNPIGNLWKIFGFHFTSLTDLWRRESVCKKRRPKSLQRDTCKCDALWLQTHWSHSVQPLIHF